MLYKCRQQQLFTFQVNSYCFLSCRWGLPDRSVCRTANADKADGGCNSFVLREALEAIGIPVKTLRQCWVNVGSPRTRGTNIKPALVQCLVFALMVGKDENISDRGLCRAEDCVTLEMSVLIGSRTMNTTSSICLSLIGMENHK